MGTETLKKNFQHRLEQAIEMKFQALQKENNNTRDLFVVSTFYVSFFPNSDLKKIDQNHRRKKRNYTMGKSAPKFEWDLKEKCWKKRPMKMQKCRRRN